jgi:hypothetical protein
LRSAIRLAMAGSRWEKEGALPGLQRRKAARVLKPFRAMSRSDQAQSRRRIGIAVGTHCLMD